MARKAEKGFSMSCLVVKWPRGWTFTPCFTALFFCSRALLSAGDPIIITKEKSKNESKLEPPTESRFGLDLFKPWERMPSGSPFDVTPPSSTERTTPYDRKREKKLQNAEDERKNWLLLEPGELQKKDDEEYSFGVRDYNLDGIDKENTSRNYLFYGLAESRNSGQGRSPGRSQSRVPGQAQSRNTRPEQPREDADADSKRTESRDSLKLFGNSESQSGAHTASELNLKSLFDPSQSGGALSGKMDQSEPSLQSLFNPGGASIRTPAQQARMDEFKQILNASPSGSSLSSPLAPAGFPNDLNRQQSDPGLARPLDIYGKSPGNPTTTLPNFGGAPNRPISPGLPSAGLPEMNSPRASGFNSLPSPAFAPSGRTPPVAPPPTRRF